MTVMRINKETETYCFRIIQENLNNCINLCVLQVGTYNPIANKVDGIKEITANSERVHYWLSCGAQPTDRVAWIFGLVGNYK